MYDEVSMHAPSYSRFFPFLIASLIGGCISPAEETDESVEFDEQIGQAQQAVTQADKDWWKGLWQIDRNLKIWQRAYQDYDPVNPKFVGLSCKEWIRKVVLDASHGVVSLPSTTNGGLGWTWYGSSYVQSLGKSINSATMGDIVQMNLGENKPHTALVEWNDGTNITWIESNWKLDNKVRRRMQTISAFISSVTFSGVQHYTVYRITGG